MNWLGILIGFVALTVLGGVWFAVLFPQAYNRSLGRDAGAKPPRSALFFAGPPVTGLIVTVTSAILMADRRIDTYGGAWTFGLVVGVGYLAANTVMIAINPNFPRPLLYAAISAGYNVIGSLLVSTILVAV